MLDHNDAGSTWTVTELGDGHFTISAITINAAVPEPAAWAALAGIVALLARAAAVSRRQSVEGQKSEGRRSSPARRSGPSLQNAPRSGAAGDLRLLTF
ncbi:MAG: hypothetical protein LBK99_01265 [Opitutaceae bacterium]|jgi:hypothetical protein|nr:hypothetical protein [Opitutaceae bacterium]